MNSEEITISSIGDVSFAGGFLKHGGLAESWIDGDVKGFLCADVRIANMEYVILPENEQWPGGLCLAEGADSVKALKFAGINVATLGNNHILDFKREQGMLAAMKALDAEGIRYCGAGMNLAEARKPAVLEVKGKKIAVFSRLHDYSFVNVKPVTAGEHTPGVALLDPDEITETVRQYRKSGQCDIAVLCIHWGMQNLHHHTKCVHELGMRLLDSGIDLVVGSHSHILQGLLEYRGKFCFYGQGNFYFYPYPLAGQPNGVLYGPEAVRHRIAAASKFSYDGSRWHSAIITTVQGPDEIVHRLPEKTDAVLQRKVRNVWSQYHPFAFHVSWRLEKLSLKRKRMFQDIKDRNLKGVCWFLNPWRWLKDLIEPDTLG